MEKSRLRPAKSEVERLLADNSKAEKLLNWVPKLTLDEGLKTTIDWFADGQNRLFYRPDVYSI